MKYLILLLLLPGISLAQTQEIDQRIREARIQELNQQDDVAFTIYNQIYDDCLVGKIFCPGSSKLFLSQKTKRTAALQAPRAGVSELHSPQTSTLHPSWTWATAAILSAMTIKYLKDNRYEVDFLAYTIAF